MSGRTGPVKKMFEEDPMEAQGRKDADFLKIEALLFEKLTEAGASSVSLTATQKIPGTIVQSVLGFLGTKNPFVRNANDKDNEVWILDNTAFKSSEASTWRAEVVGCFFQHGRGDITKAVAAIVDAIGLDGKPGPQEASKAIIQQRLKPFIDAVAPARTLPVVIEAQNGPPTKRSLGPTNTSGISIQVFDVGAYGQKDGEVNHIRSDPSIASLPEASGTTRLAGPQGWGVISDIDDTIKITQTPDPIGILKTTFAEPAQFTSHMPDFYKILDEQLQKPTWFYLSASPYNLYTFLHKFIGDYYPKGTIILRDASWQTLGGLLGSLTQGTKAYKSSRIDKIHEWLPDRKFVCIGDSTQMDPETYAAAYDKYPGWIKAIYIRKVLDAPHMEAKNKPERFERAFKGVPPTLWKVFVLPDELKDHISHVAGEAHLSLLGSLTGFFCGQERERQQLEKDRVKP